jgi:F-type H+-transporting ATPase subunit delta
VPADPAGHVYGTALYAAAKDVGRAPEIERDLVAIREALTSSTDLTRILYNPAFPARGKKEILLELATGADALVRNFLQVLVDNGRLTELDDTIEVLSELVRESEKQLQVELTTAVPVGNDEADLLRDRLAEASGKDVTLSRRVDPAVVGGIVLRIGDNLIDASVRGRLDGLRLALRQARIVPGGSA